ncbi:MAG: PIG-L family deacetylase [Clostridiales bacterium]|nr:PIG-L family deacetylase [Roseburia sp.]MDD7636311.1 PIG-L family deacetylase [Clostridiales bacterium]MDY4112623.1 PIG-L deacetylase family protein [Roseburia sp.]
MKILVIAPHPDDEILGVGGTMARYASEGHQVFVCVVTKGSLPLFDTEEVKKVRLECQNADNLIGVEKTFFLDFPAAMLEEIPRYRLNDSIAEIIRKIEPDEVYLPHRGDMQIDHKMIVDAAMVALRPRYKHVIKRIYAYETLSETGWDIPNIVNEFIPTVYTDISDFIEKKVEALNFFESQMAEYPNVRSVQAVRALAMYRGATVNLKAAEAFSLIREIKLQGE